MNDLLFVKSVDSYIHHAMMRKGYRGTICCFAIVVFGLATSLEALSIHLWERPSVGLSVRGFVRMWPGTMELKV